MDYPELLKPEGYVFRSSKDDYIQGDGPMIRASTWNNVRFHSDPLKEDGFSYKKIVKSGGDLPFASSFVILGV